MPTRRGDLMSTDTARTSLQLRSLIRANGELEVSLRDEQWFPIKPFILTVRQQEAVLLDHKKIAGDCYQVANIEPAAYQFELSEAAGERRVVMGWTAA